MTLPPELLHLLRGASPCYLATLMPDGSPQLTQTWVDTDGTAILINSVLSHQKVRNVQRDPRVSVTVSDPDDSSRYAAVRGQVTEITTSRAADHIEHLAQRYLGTPYPWYGGHDQQRVILSITPDRINTATL
jgi:PPOX class probable F420-dependent enzyme